MADDLGFICSCCGRHHAELPMQFSAMAPDVWSETFAGDSASMLSPDQCVIKNEYFFIRGLIEIPVIDSDVAFSRGVRVSLSRDSFARVLDLWEAPGREAEPPCFGWLSTELGLYSPSTANLKTRVHTRPVGQRPFIGLEPTDHPLAVEQRTGVT
ncbi:DUF2199 domain-containing protein [Streptomyces sp. NPDC002580]|uniref:DUF2199 domain-containing protein n=1 Tax=Streptomyces sp. NPDC002580 TaxID=3364653 RepID=UPI0036A0674A